MANLVKLPYKMCFQYRVFPVSCCPRADMKDLREINTALDSNNIQLNQSYFVTYRKKLEEVIFVGEQFLHKKINKKGVYVEYDAMVDIPEDEVGH